MRRMFVVLGALAVPLLVAGCATELSEQDRAMIQQAQTDAREAKLEAARAAAAAEAAAAEARAASERADRMFARSQRKVQ
ncbi:alanine-zipper protein [Azospirillum sp. ST 5-10]|uniref:alanine-zipper protein n=1 Tax=unclassified Azospirillum TaxID=2630922 RepID=UPI003F4A0CEA